MALQRESLLEVRPLMQLGLAWVGLLVGLQMRAQVFRVCFGQRHGFGAEFGQAGFEAVGQNMELRQLVGIVHNLSIRVGQITKGQRSNLGRVGDDSHGQSLTPVSVVQSVRPQQLQ